MVKTVNGYESKSINIYYYIKNIIRHNFEKYLTFETKLQIHRST